MLIVVVALVIVIFGIFSYSLICVASRADEHDNEMYEQWIALHGKDSDD